TGIDQAALQQRPPTAPEARIAELTQKLRADQIREQQRVAAERIERPESRPLATPTLPPAPTMPPVPTMAPPQPTSEAIENAARAAVAAAVLPMIEDVTTRPIPPKPSLFPEQPAAGPAEPPPAPRAFIPPAPERTPNRAPRRMPGIEELPRPA